ncbi:MAG: type II toxin-antitoxin system VapC family toxin [Burkholderiales bacterium]
MKLLLDTHALLWALSAPKKLPAGIREALEDSANIVFASAASAWEMAIKQARGKLRYPAAELAAALRRVSVLELPVTIRHAEAAATLPPFHRDPFDRMLVAQAQTEGLSLVSRDPAVRQYQVTVLWEPELQAPRAAYRAKRAPRRR